MPTIYLSPSTQQANLYVNGGTEEYYMNLIADAMIPYLKASGIGYVRNTPDMTASSSIRASNAGNYDLHFALHSNAAPEGMYGKYRGTDIYYYPGSAKGKRAADIVAENLKSIYPLPSKVRAVPTTALGEVRQTKAPSVFVELAYHDNLEDALWIQQNIQKIAANLVLSLTEYFGIPFIAPTTVRTGYVVTSSGGLNIRSRPTTDSSIKGRIPRGESVTVYGQTGDWYVVEHKGIIGYVNRNYIRF